jgi:hypothetical protein
LFLGYSVSYALVATLLTGRCPVRGNDHGPHRGLMAKTFTLAA